jgi:hypothetical protein
MQAWLKRLLATYRSDCRRKFAGLKKAGLAFMATDAARRRAHVDPIDQPRFRRHVEIQVD